MVRQLKDFYENFTQGQISKLSDVYSEDVVFCDPVNTFNGLISLSHYFERLMGNCKKCHFAFHHTYSNADSGWIQWTMYFQHPNLNFGNQIQVEGISVFKVKDAKVIYQRDYYDLGEMIYEKVPLLGTLVSSIKKRMHQ